VLHVALALLGGLLTFVGARARQKATDDATFRKLMDNYCAAWSSGTVDAPGKFYAQDNQLVFYDLAPFSYHGWKEYQEGVKHEFLDGAAAIKLTAGNLGETRGFVVVGARTPFRAVRDATVEWFNYDGDQNVGLLPRGVNLSC
jgi:hypothetical protein